MITLGILHLIVGLLNATFGAFPAGSALGLTAKVDSMVNSGLFNHLGWLNDYVPVDSVVAGGEILLAVFGIMWLVRVGIWVLTKVHLLGGSGD